MLDIKTKEKENANNRSKILETVTKMRNKPRDNTAQNHPNSKGKKPSNIVSYFTTNKIGEMNLVNVQTL